MKIFVCSPLRGADGQPSARNVELAKRLTRAVFDAGHHPFTPHLLYPQVLTESEGDLKAAFAANYAFLVACDEVWVYANYTEGLTECSSGMRAEVEYTMRRNEAERASGRGCEIELRFMPECFAAVRDQFAADFSQKTSHLGTCAKCGNMNNLNSQELCLRCFSGGTS